MKIFDLPFEIANEVVKRVKRDNRKLKIHDAKGGNNIFYLGTNEVFISKLDNNIKLITELNRVKNLLNDRTRNPIAIQKNEGILVEHKICKKSLISLLPFLKSFLEEHCSSYHNPNLDYDLVKKKLMAIEGDYLLFNSDLVYIHDNNSSKPYFKWFTQKNSANEWRLIQEFLIPKLSFLNFNFENYQDDLFKVTWDLTYAPVVMYSSDNIEDIISNSIEKLITNERERETIMEAITKIRVGQSQFRSDLLNSDLNTCIFTDINDPKLLIASHIKPWKESTNIERRDFHNGLLLTPTFDKLFDRFLITFDETGNLLWTSNRLEKNIILKLKSSILTREENIIDINDDNRSYFNFHREKFNQLEEENN
ncbi:HNH endonuclease [Winogradskyella eximia]|uniref:HNH endonuclease n=1 Tax=Winogradskyella eximia TaxID=262006 RepID=A0A3D9H4J9_9FLAO|nr:HNH endonuclease signature motif containing protein [Winogradskyella eximia]RED44390.1 HNH endonuclease [Winogradskyella eximia]